MPDLTIPDDGFAEFVIGDVAKKLDVYRAYNELLEFDRAAHAEHPDEDAVAARQVAYLDRVCDLLERLGFGRVSHRAADKFDAALIEAADALGKADGTAPTPDSPASTASVPSS